MISIELPEGYNRFNEALQIQNGGACNPSGIARSLVMACKQCLNEGVSQRKDPAVRLIVHQLAHLTNCYEIDHGLYEYGQLMKACADKLEGQASAEA